MIDSAKLLSAVPSGLRLPLIESYQEIVKGFSEHRWEPAELNGGKFCECVYTIAHGYLTGSFPASPSKPKNMVDACDGLKKLTSATPLVGDHSLRILIPRMLLPLYDIRNNRGVGHVGGDVDPNFMDATAVLGMTSWIMAELVRIFHGATTAEAQAAVDVLAERKHPLVWGFDKIKRVLDPKMKIGDQVLLLLHTEPSWVDVSTLLSWVEYSGLAMFRVRILKPFHKGRLLEYDEVNKRVRLSPRGVLEVEKQILPRVLPH